MFTSDAARSRAEAFAVKNGRFIAVGSTGEFRNVATARTRVIDAQQMFVTPGFIDCHCHPSGVQELYGVNTNVKTVREVQAAIRRKAESTPPGLWINGFQFDDTKLDRPLTKKDLDEATTEHPVVVAHRGGHTSWYNSKALELAGITNDTPDPPDGRFFRKNGELTGRVAENARGVFNRVGKRETFTPEQRRDRARDGMRHMSQLFSACGLTSVHNAGTNSEHILAYEDCRKNGELTHPAYMMIRSTEAFNGFKAANIYTGFGDEWIRVGGIKFVADGSASERTMRMSTPYVGTNDYGILTMTQEQVYEAVDDAHSHNFQVGIRWMFAHKSFLDAGIRVPGASDYNPGPFEPLMAIQSMVTRKDYKGRVWGANQKVSVDEALTIATINGVYPSFEENLKGSIAAGKLADFVMLEKDPHEVDPDQIMNIKVNRTVIGGRIVYPNERT